MNPFSTEGFMKRGECGDWSSALLWTMNVSDLIVGASFFGISALMFFVVYMRRDVPMRWLWILLGVTTWFCGTTHLVSVLMTWWPAWWFEALTRVASAALCLTTFIGFCVSVPKTLRLVSPEQLVSEQSDFTKEVAMLVEGLDKDREAINQRTRECLAQVRARLSRIDTIRVAMVIADGDTTRGAD